MRTIYNLKCTFCKKSFSRSSKDVASNKNRSCKNVFCSKECNNNYSKTHIYCNNCKKSITTINSVPRKFCSKSCSATYNNKHKTKGTRRSKLEIYLENELSMLYPNLKIDYNKKDTIGSELDIYIPSLKLAIELNGIFHYEPIYGQDKLNQIQFNDQNKFQQCQKLGISLCVIDTSAMINFKIEKANKYLDIIVSVISQAELVSSHTT